MISFCKRYFFTLIILIWGHSGVSFGQNSQKDRSVKKAEALLTESNTLLKKNPEKAILDLKRAQFIFKNNQIYNKEVDCILSLAEVHIRLSDYDVGYSLLTNAYSLALEYNLIDQQYMALNSLGRVSAYLNEIDRSLDFYEDALILAMQSKDKIQRLIIEANIAYTNMYYKNVLTNEGFEKIYNFYEVANSEPMDTLMFLSASNLLGGAYFWIKNDMDESTKYFNQCIQISLATQDFYRVSLVSNNLGEMLFRSGRVVEAEKVFNNSLGFAREVNSKLLLFNCFKHLANCAEFRGDFKRSLELFKLYVELKQDVINEDLIRKTREIHSLYQMERKAREKDRQRANLLINKKEAENNLLIYQGMAGIIFFILVFIISLYVINKKRLTESLEKKKIIEEQNRMLLIINKDLWEQRKFADEANIEAEQAIKSKIDFLSIITHELRTPLNAVIGTVQLLQEESPPAYQQKSLDILKFSADNLLNLVNDILDFNKIEAGKVKLEKKAFSLIALLQNIKNSLQLKASEKGLDLILRIDKDLPKAFIGDKLRLGQVFYNLVSNALKFTNKGSVEIEVRYFPNVAQSNILAIVKDTGIGIEQSKQKSIFDFFSQADTSIGRKFGGSGLGLTISKNLLNLMGSSIQLESEVGQGSKFYFYLSLLETSKSFLEKESTFDTNDSGLDSSSRILFVEDVDFNRVVAERFFKKWNLNFNTAQTAKEAIDFARKIDYDLILMDLQLPDMDGFQATMEIRKLVNHKDTVILALTAASLSDVKEQMEQSKFDGFIQKPFVSNDLKNAIQFWLGFAKKKHA